MRNISAVLVLVSLPLAGCGGLSFNSTPSGSAIKKSQPEAVLEVPPDLVGTTSEEITAAQAAQEERAKKNLEVLPESYVTELKEDGDQHWLEIDASPQKVWFRLLAYWDSVGIGLVTNQPQTGIMETGWIAPEKKPGAVQTLFAGLNDSGYDKYTVKLERLGDEKTKLIVSHAWSQKVLVVYPVKDAEATWIESEDPEKELELLKAFAFEMDPSQILGG